MKCVVILFLPSVLALLPCTSVFPVDVREEKLVANTWHWLNYLKWSLNYWSRVGIAKEWIVDNICSVTWIVRHWGWVEHFLSVESVCYTMQQLVYSSALLMFWVSAFKNIFYRIKDWGQTCLWMSSVMVIIEKIYWASQPALVPFPFLQSCNSGCKFAKDVFGRKKPKLWWHGNCHQVNPGPRQPSCASLCPAQLTSYCIVQTSLYTWIPGLSAQF